MPTMLILRGNSDTTGERYPDEQGKMVPWPDGALHEQPAKDFATRKGYTPKVLNKSGDPTPAAKDAPVGKDGKRHGARYDSPQTRLGYDTFRDDKSITAFYGFSGGGYNLWWILSKMTPDERKRVDLVVVVGVDTDKPASEFEKSKFKGAHYLRFLPLSDKLAVLAPFTSRSYGAW